MKKTTTWHNWMRYSGPALLYAVQNNLNIYATSYLSAHVFALFNNGKVVFAAVCAKFLLGQKFSIIQWLSLFLLVLALCVSKLKTLLGLPTCKPVTRWLSERCRCGRWCTNRTWRMGLPDGRGGRGGRFLAFQLFFFFRRIRSSSCSDQRKLKKP